MSTRQDSRVTAFVKAVGVVSGVLAAISLLVMLVIMLIEIASRYFFSAPLGWNVSAVEGYLLPASVFLALPWLYTTAGHVSAEIIYTRLPARWQKGARGVAVFCVVVAAVILTVAGARETLEALSLGDFPAPGTSDVKLPTWLRLVVQPLGAGFLIIVAVLDAPRYIRSGELTEPGENEDQEAGR